MSEIKQIIEELINIHNGNAQHGASLAEALNGVNYLQAAVRPGEDAHSIWEIVVHITGWEEVFCNRLKGHIINAPENGDFPSLGKINERTWMETLEKLKNVHEKLLKTTKKLPDLILNETVGGKDYSHRFLLRETINHKIYHTGQIALLKKVIPN